MEITETRVTVRGRSNVSRNTPLRNSNDMHHHGKSFAKRSWAECKAEHEEFLRSKGKKV